jgi:hypothetical protein
VQGAPKKPVRLTGTGRLSINDGKPFRATLKMTWVRATKNDLGKNATGPGTFVDMSPAMAHLPVGC